MAGSVWGAGSQGKFLTKNGDMRSSGVGGARFKGWGHTKTIKINEKTVFIDRQRGRMANMQQWWGNRGSWLVLGVHTGVNFQ